MSKLCPIHDAEMVRKQTRYGPRWSCPCIGCTVVCWTGQTSTPADQATRNLRQACHALFDPLWKAQDAPMSRNEAYKWMQEVMELKPKAAHIGMMSAGQCAQFLTALTSKMLAEART